MTAPQLSVNGVRVLSAELHVPFSGRWTAALVLEGSQVPIGAVTATLGTLELNGTVYAAKSGGFVGHTVLRVIAGAGKWANTVPARSYHNEARIRRSEMLDALARDVGETIDTAGDTTRLGRDHQRLDGPGVHALESLLGSNAWRVDFDGVTRYGARPAATLAADVELLEADPLRGEFTFAAGDPGGVPIGATLTDKRLTGSYVIRELYAELGAAQARMTAWGIAA